MDVFWTDSVMKISLSLVKEICLRKSTGAIMSNILRINYCVLVSNVLHLTYYVLHLAYYVLLISTCLN